MQIQDMDALCYANAVDLKMKGFKVYEVEAGPSKAPAYSRRDFYKIALLIGKSVIHYADKSIQLNGASLFFANPYVPYAAELLSDTQTGYACLFTEDFLKAHDRSDSLQESPLFKIGGNPVFALNDDQTSFVSTIFRKTIAEQDTEYVFKDDLVRNYINLIIHEALKMQPSESFVKHRNASARITSLFLDLLERQFPIESMDRPLLLRTAQDYAKSLSVHVNHLNRSVKEITGKSTTALITERIISEARALLQHTSWTIAEIAFALGFEYPTYFNNYFKRITGTVPKALRAQAV